MFFFKYLPAFQFEDTVIVTMNLLKLFDINKESNV